MLENIYRRFQAADATANTFDLIADATAEAVRPVLFSVLVIIVALIPLFTMEGVPGKIFAPMSETYGFALFGALLFAILFAPVLASWMRPEKVRGASHPAGRVALRALPEISALDAVPPPDRR